MMIKPTHASCRARAFTLVELLVVIGIIALLISILLPSLNKARQQANLVKCQSNLHTIGQALSIYAAEHKAMMPLGQIDHAAVPGNAETQWYWIFALGEVMNRNMLASDGYVRSLSRVFTDSDTVEGGYSGTRWVSHYTSNPRIFLNPSEFTFGTKASPLDVFRSSLSANRKMTDVKQSARVFVVWDGPQGASFYYPGENNTYPVAKAIDGWGLYFTGLCYPNGDINGIKVEIGLPIWPNALGDPGIGNAAAAQKQYNVDSDSSFGDGNPPWQSFRFRHMKNTKLNALCLDGHVESRAVGTLLRSDIYTNAP